MTAVEDRIAQATKPRGRRREKPSCDRCFFGVRGLCALQLQGPCSTFRPDDPAGLAPPRQPTLLLRDPAAAPETGYAADPSEWAAA